MLSTIHLSLLNNATFMLRDKVHFPFSVVTVIYSYIFITTRNIIFIFPFNQSRFPLVALQHPAANHTAHNSSALLLGGNCLCRAPVTIALTPRRSNATIHASQSIFIFLIIIINIKKGRSLSIRRPQPHNTNL